MRNAWGILIIALLFFALPVHGQACGVATAAGILPDTDCDGAPDALDNCPLVANSQQQDLNRNGRGDACEAIIEEVTVQPDTHIRQGEFAHLTLRVMNNRAGPITDVAITAANADLNARETRTVASVPAGETAALDFWIKVPECASTGRYTLTLTASFKEPYTHLTTEETQHIVLTVDKGSRCGRAQGPLDNTIISVFGKVDLDRGQDVIIPVTITNKGGQADYHVSVEDLGAWGSWRVDPRADVTLPAGHETTVFLYLQTEDHTPPGTNTIELVVTSDGQKTVVPIDVYVRAPLARSWAFGAFVVKAILIILLMVLIGFILLLLVLALDKRHERKRNEKGVRKAPPRKTVAVEKAEKPRRETYY